MLEAGPHMTAPIWSMLELVGLGLRLMYILTGLSVTISMVYMHLRECYIVLMKSAPGIVYCCVNGYSMAYCINFHRVEESLG